MAEAPASVIVRSRDSAATIERTFRTLRDQTAAVEIVVVGSGSTDATLDLARQWADRVVTIPPRSFSFGGALNEGARAASAPIHFALSSHCYLERRDWIERSLAHYARSDVAATGGAYFSFDGRRMLEPVYQTAEAVRANPFWGFSNHAGSWRASVWERFPFDEQIEACEDKEWAWRVLQAGWVIAFDPFLVVESLHRRTAGLRPFYRRVEREARAQVAAGLPVPKLTVRGSLRQWWSEFPKDSPYPPMLHRLSYLRAAELVARYKGQRQARSRASGGR